MPEVSKYDLEIQSLKGEITLLSERISTIKDNHLHHIEEVFLSFLIFQDL